MPDLKEIKIHVLSYQTNKQTKTPDQEFFFEFVRIYIEIIFLIWYIQICSISQVVLTIFIS